MKTRLLLLTAFLSVATLAMGQSDNIDILVIQEYAKEGSAEAQLLVGYYYYEGKGVTQDYGQAVYWWNKAAEQGKADAQYNLGTCYYYGYGVTKNLAQAVYWFRKAAKNGNKNAQEYLPALEEELRKQQPVEDNDYQKNIAAAQQGDADAQNVIGYCYSVGEGVAKDHEQALYWWRKAAAKNHKVAQKNIGLAYQYGKGVAQDYTQAFYWYQKAANQGLADAQNSLGVCYKNGYGVAQDFAQAAYWYQKAAEQGNIYAQYNLGNFYAKGEGVAKDYAQAVYWLRKAADQGDEDAKRNLAKAEQLLQEQQSSGQNNQQNTTDDTKSKGFQLYQQKEYTEAFYYFNLAANNGDVESMLYLAQMCYYGEGVEVNYNTAAHWWNEAAKRGNANAQFNLGTCYYNGKGVTQDLAQAVAWIREAAKNGSEKAKYFLPDAEEALNSQQSSTEQTEDQKLFAEYMQTAKQGNADSQAMIGYLYYTGKGVSQDYVQAIAWFRKAANQGHVVAQYCLGNCYYSGEGVDQDYVQAFAWYRKAANQGYANAQGAIASCYYGGEGVTKDLTQAIYWYRKAADQGYDTAQAILGFMYYNGEGVTQDYAQAVDYFRKAAAQGQEKAIEFLPKAEQALREQQDAEQNKHKQINLPTFEWLNFASTVNQKEYQLKVGIKSASKIEETKIMVNGSLSRGINTVKSDGYDQTINQTLKLSEGTNNIEVIVRNADGTASSTKVITCQVSHAIPDVSNGKRIALVIGNSNYTNSSALKNPVNDATDVAKKLKTLGFTVICSLDQTKRGMETAINDFGIKAQGYDVALFFYAGHGISYNGNNYMIPIDANLAAEEDVQYDCTNTKRVLDKMQKANCKMKIMILDACRDLPNFARGWHRSVGDGGGFKDMSAPRGTYIAYATAEGDVAQDGKGRNSPYTTALLETFDEPNLPLSLFFERVTGKVIAATNERQNPWNSGSVSGTFIFNQK